MPNPLYVGRFAPSPSGPLHLGSLIAAIISYCDAKHHQGLWRLRIDDLDTPRVQPNAITQQLEQLKAFGLTWDGDIYYQSEHLDDYHKALKLLQANQACYACHCTRQMIRDRQQGDVTYDNYCRNKKQPFDLKHAWRLKLPTTSNSWHDAWCGAQQPLTPSEDPVIWRRDQIFGYHLACAWDELAMGITHVVRGQDLLAASWPQRWLRQQWQTSAPALIFKHHPLLFDLTGTKLSKSANSPAVWPNQGALFKIAEIFGVASQLNATMPDSEILAVIQANWTHITAHYLTHNNKNSITTVI
ncbi:tRNA glutamyl-Q(34) synthetase GluQRS [Thiomicrospira cyclica]|uniref:Glutamyl/glutaminyl-tRNA synthetase, class Ic, catalytic domain protein n=1 Tax=Thiomicrospira cyclica (strain DSM 14477 / JCM 11371 / ALM1) TaxID=717773 RepID=F6DCB0_THICA|nr:tRNA glutamyl-Q(34) synthetase GluQRS [Thiomicrospira cyclica]AEG31496.1 Glutamyl/glutaminyl-tRNA synthetase, class Ic, catalytic domain protein [Thiomicrospira cyclica ALM1]